MFSSRIPRVVAAAAAAIVLLLPGCAGSGSSAEQNRDPALAPFEEAAFDEGQLTVYTGAGESQIKALVDAFSEDYPEISVDYFRAAGTSLFNRFASEQKSGAVTADVFIPTVQPSFVQDHPDWFVPLTEDVMPKAGGWPKRFRTKTTVEVAVEEVVAVYNTDSVPKPPTSWDQLLDERYRGKIILTDPKASPGYMSWYSIMRKREGDDFLKKLAALDPLWVDTGAVGAQQVATGGYAVSLPSYPSHVVSLKEEGAPVDMVRDLDPTQGLTTSVAITSGAPNPAAAKLFANWLVSKSGYQALCADSVYSGTIDGTPCAPLAKHYVAPAWDLPESEQQRVLKLLGR